MREVMSSGSPVLFLLTAQESRNGGISESGNQETENTARIVGQAHLLPLLVTGQLATSPNLGPNLCYIVGGDALNE